MPYQESFVTIAGCKTRLMRGGSGAPLLFLHGARGASAWLPFWQNLAQRYDVIVPEHPGFGGSDTPDWLDRVGDLAYFYLEFLDALNLRAVHLAGISLGGWIAAEIAIRDAAALRSLTLIAPAGLDLPGVEKGDIFGWSREEFTRNLFHNPDYARAALAIPQSEAERVNEAKNKAATARLGEGTRLASPDLHKWLRRVRVPTLIVFGDDDKVIPQSYGPAFHALIPGSRLEVIAQCGHAPQIEKAGELAERMTRFIEAQK